MAVPTTSAPTALDLKLRLGMPHPLPPGKAACVKCRKNKQWFCPECLIPCMPEGLALPQIRLPLKLHVLRGREEKAVTSKATGTHAKILAPQDTTIYQLPDFPHYADPSRTLLLFPSPTSKLITQLPDLSKFDTLLVVDTTWQKVGGVMQLPQLAAPFQHVAISSYSTLFWRYQPVGPQCVSTIEAVYFFMREWEVERRRRAALASLPAEPAHASSEQNVPVISSSPISSDSNPIIGQDHDRMQLEQPSSSSSSSSSSSTDVSSSSSISDDNSGSSSSASTSSAVSAPPRELPRAALQSLAPWDPGNVLYDGGVDPLLLLFLGTYALIQKEYTAGKHSGKDFTPRHRPGYIKGAASGDAAGASGDADGGDNNNDDDGEEAGAGEPSAAKRRKQAPPSSSSSSASSSASDIGPKKPERIRGAWAIRTDVMDPVARAWTENRMERFLTNTKPLLSGLDGSVSEDGRRSSGTAASAAAQLESSAAPSEPSSSSSSSSSATAKLGGPDAAVVTAACFLRVQSIQRQEYAVRPKPGALLPGASGSAGAASASEAAAAGDQRGDY